MESQATKTTLWQKAVAVCMSVVLVLGLSPKIPGAQSQAVADEGLQAAQLVMQESTGDAAVDELNDIVSQLQEAEANDALCAQAKAKYDALTDAQKALLDDPGYFEADAPASLDNPLNTAPDKTKEILVVSFGTSFNESRSLTIGGVENAIQAAYPDWSVRRAFTSQIIINHILTRDNVKINRVDEALEAAVKAGVQELAIVPTHLMKGKEYDELAEAVEAFKTAHSSMNVSMTEPLLGDLGLNGDKEVVATAVTDAAVKDAGYASRSAAVKDKAAFVFMGHGTSHDANLTYEQMQTQMDTLGYSNVFIGSVEGEEVGDEERGPASIIARAKAAGYTKVFLRPLMVVAGDHAHNDMADPEDEESWYSQFVASKAFKSVECQIAGLGQIEKVQDLYVEHVAQALPGTITLDKITNSSPAKMFKAETARVEDYNGSTGYSTLTVTLSGTGYKYLAKGSRVDVMKGGDDPAAAGWIEGSLNVYGLMEFKVPIAPGEMGKDIPIVSVSKKYYDGYKKGDNELEKALYARQFTIDLENRALTTNDYKADDATAAKELDDMIVELQKATTIDDQLCRAANVAWSDLSDEGKKLVEQADYFEADAPASKDNALNTAPDKKNEMLVVSFGTSYNGSRAADIGGIEGALQATYPDWSVRRAFTSQIIINHIFARDNVKINRVDEALADAVKAGVENLVVVPTHLMKGKEYTELKEAVDAFKATNSTMNVAMSEPLLGELGANADKEAVAKAVSDTALSEVNYRDLDAAKNGGTAFVFLGHGTDHNANLTYGQMQDQMDKLGDNVFIGSVESEDVGDTDRTAESIIARVKALGCDTVVMRPLMVVAGDHANNDMAGAESGSWKSMFEAEGLTVKPQIAGLGQIKDVQDIYLQHVAAVAPKLKATAPTAAKKLTYNTKKQTGVKPGTGYTLSGTTSATKAGSYKAVAKLNTGFVWADGKTADKTITWKIAQASAKAKTALKKTFKASNLKKKAASFKAITLTTDGKITWKVTKNTGKKYISFAKGKVTVKKGTPKGAYTLKVKASAKAGKNYKVLKAKTYTIKVTVKK